MFKEGAHRDGHRPPEAKAGVDGGRIRSGTSLQHPEHMEAGLWSFLPLLMSGLMPVEVWVGCETRT